MFSKELEISIGQCYKQARDSRHEFMTVDHLLLALLDNASARQRTAKACGADIDLLSAGACARPTMRTSPILPEDDNARYPAHSRVSSASCSVPSTTYSPRARKKSTAPMCWLPSSARKTHIRSILMQKQDITRSGCGELSVAWCRPQRQ